jgi:hypothetical protein
LECKATQYDQKEDVASVKSYDEIFMFNLVSFGLNLIMIIFISSIVVNIMKYQNLKEEKMNKYRWLLRNKKNYESESTLEEILKSWPEEDGAEVDVHMFSFWNVVLILSNLFNILANLIIFINGLSLTFKLDQIEFFITVFLGFGCFFSWINILYILGQYENFSLVNKTLSNSAPSIFWFAVGISPIFLAYVFSGYCMYHETNRFKNLQTSYLSMLAMFAGDEIDKSFEDTADYPLSNLYTYSYTFTFLLVIANVFVFLIESGYQMELKEIEKRQEKKKL